MTRILFKQQLQGCMLSGKNCLCCAGVNCPTFLLPCDVYTAKNSTGLLTVTLHTQHLPESRQTQAHGTRKFKVAIKRAFVCFVLLVIPPVDWAVILNVASAYVFNSYHSRWQVPPVLHFIVLYCRAVPETYQKVAFLIVNSVTELHTA